MAEDFPFHREREREKKGLPTYLWFSKGLKEREKYIHNILLKNKKK